MASCASLLRRIEVLHVIEHCALTWKWSRVDVARAMVHVLPSTKPPKTSHLLPKKSDTPTMVWDDIPSIAAELRAQSSMPRQDSEAPAVHHEPLLEALIAVDTPKKSRSAHSLVLH
jgi:hypothetical protein